MIENKRQNNGIIRLIWGYCGEQRSSSHGSARDENETALIKAEEVAARGTCCTIDLRRFVHLCWLPFSVCLIAYTHNTFAVISSILGK